MSKGCCGGSSGAVYGFGFLGALVYFFQHAVTFSDYIVGAVKAIIWPAMLVYRALELTIR